MTKYCWKEYRQSCVISLRLILAVHIFVNFACHAILCEEVDRIVLQPNEVKYVDIQPKQVIRFKLYSVGHNTAFIVFQVHTYQQPMTLSFTWPPTEDNSITGRDVGVVTKPSKEESVSWYVSYEKGHFSKAIRTLVLASLYEHGVPIPGGCNMEFSLLNDPNLHITYKHGINLVQFQYAHQGLSMNSDCDAQISQMSLQYMMYQQYIESGENNTFHGIETMLTPQLAMKNGRKMQTFSPIDRTEQQFAAFLGKAVIYNVIVVQHHREGTSSLAAYIPGTTHSCHDNQTYCTYMDGSHAFLLVVLILLGLMGLFICFLGHRFFKTEVFVFGFLGLFIVSFILVQRWSYLSVSLMTLVAVLSGLFGGIIWLLLWYYKGIPVVTVLFMGLVAGYLIASIVFNITPLGSWRWWQVPVNYGMAFSATVLILPVLLLAFTKILNIICCALVGSYMVVFVIDVFVQGSIHMIVLLSVHKAVWDDMLKAIVSLPYQWSDLVLAVVWLLLAVAGATTQFWREHHRAPFPPCPWQQRQLQRHPSTLWQQRTVAHPTAPPLTDQPHSGSTEEDDENEPLLQALRQMEYQTNKQNANITEYH